MKKLNVFSLLAAMLIAGAASAQTISWSTLDSSRKQYLNLNAGLEYGLVYSAGYAYRIHVLSFPVLFCADYSMPSGQDILGDFKARTGIQVRWYQYHHFSFSTGIYGVFRRYQDNFVRLFSYGSDMNGTLGYYRRHWFAAAETGFDKAISTHFKHSETYREQFPGVHDGWYQPATGGNFYYGLKAGVSFGRSLIYLDAGKLLSQDFRTAPLLPFYGKIGYTVNF